MTEEQKCKVTFWSPHNKNMETGFRRGLIPSFLATWFSSASKSITSERHFELFDRLCRLNTGGSAFRISLVRAPNCMYICIPSSGGLHQAYVIMPLHDLSHFSLLMTLIYTWRTLHSRRLTLSSFTASLSLSLSLSTFHCFISCLFVRGPKARRLAKKPLRKVLSLSLFPQSTSILRVLFTRTAEQTSGSSEQSFAHGSSWFFARSFALLKHYNYCRWCTRAACGCIYPKFWLSNLLDTAFSELLCFLIAFYSFITFQTQLHSATMHEVLLPNTENVSKMGYGDI